MSGLDVPGLRRRSPNPNSPIPYSPALLSPYIPAHYQEWPDTSQERQGHLSAGLAPTIRLVGPSEAGSSGSSYHTPLPSRSQSDDQHVRASTIASSVASLRRHGTDPKSYPSSSRFSRSRWYPQAWSPETFKDKPVPPLPHNIRKSSVPSIRSDQTSPAHSPMSISTRSVVSTLKSFRNPFRRKVESGPPSPALSTHSHHSTASYHSSDSMSSTSTLAVPFYPGTFWDTFGADKVDDPKAMERVKSAGLGGNIPSKMPMRREGAKEGWTGFKWVLLLSILTVIGYGFAGLAWALSILLRVRENSDVTMVSDPDLVIFLTLASLLCILSGLVGLTGILLNSRPILAFYNLLLWPTLLSLCLVGYTSYKRGNLQLNRKLNQTWSQFLDDEQRLRIQNSLRCCGYYNPFHDATYSRKCYPRTTLRGCKSRWTRFEHQALHEFATAAFSTTPVHLVNIACAVLCSNHVNRTFGKGLTPPHYRLRMADVRANALAILATIPTPSRPSSSLLRQPAISYKMKARSDSRSSDRSSTDTLTEPLHIKRRRSESEWVGGVLREAGPRGRALREARDRGLL